MQDEITVKPLETGLVHNFNTDLKPMVWAKIREEIAPQGVNLETNELVDKKFTLLRMKRFTSRFEGQEYAYFVVGKDSEDGELFNTVLGGGQPIEVLDAIYNAGIENPIEFVLSWHAGGQYGGYYTLD